MLNLIERLRTRKAFFINGSSWLMTNSLDADCAEAADEIEALRADLAGREKICDSYAEENQRFHDEIEALRAALLAIITSDPPKESDDWFKEWKQLAFRMKGIAREALEQNVKP